MKLTLRCGSCDAALPLDLAAAPEGGHHRLAAAPEGGHHPPDTLIRCGRCGHFLPLAVTDAVSSDRAVDRCPVCAGADFYLRKDFDPKLGLLVVIVGALISAVFYWFERDLIAYGILGGAALIDLIVYQRLGDVTVCYRCHAEFRGRYARSAPPFDLHTADEKEVEYERKIGRR